MWQSIQWRNSHIHKKLSSTVTPSLVPGEWGSIWVWSVCRTCRVNWIRRSHCWISMWRQEGFTSGRKGINACLIQVIMIIIALKGRVRDILQSPDCATNCLQHVHSSGQGVIVCKSRATHRALIMCNMSCATWYEGTAQLLSLTEFKSHLV